MRNILLVEPAYKNKYPPLGLMKLSSYHKLKGDYVEFVKGCVANGSGRIWDRIYISTLFTFHWGITIKTIQFYKNYVRDPQDIFVGGVTATLLADDIRKETGTTVVSGLLNRKGMLDKNDKCIIDTLIPDYRILEEIDYQYGLTDAYFAYATRGCPNRCTFCAVHKIEPHFQHYLSLKKQIMGIDEIYGAKQNLILMDNNVLASKQFERIIGEIVSLGFYRGAKYNGKKRFIDFNQGTDARYLTRAKMQLLAKTCIDPLRIAFDNIAMEKTYTAAITMAQESGILDLSNYVLYNHKDKPADFYKRLKINLLLNERLGTKIYSFPMKFIPLDARDRSYVGKHWNKRLLRGVQCILLATRGLISPHRAFFEAAFGASPDEFLRIAYMPDDYIIYRRKHANNGALDWQSKFNKLSPSEMSEFQNAIAKNKISNSSLSSVSSRRVKSLLSHYVVTAADAKMH